MNVVIQASEEMNEDERPTAPMLDVDTRAFLSHADAWGMTSDVDEETSWWLAQRRRWLAIGVGAFVGLCVGLLAIAFILAART